MSDLKELVVRILADATGYDKGTKQVQKDNEDIKKSSSGLGTGFLKGAAGALGFAATALGITSVGAAVSGVTDYLKGAIQGAIDMQTAQNTTNQVLSSGSHIIGLTSQTVDRLSMSLSNNTGVDDDVVRGAENIIAGYQTISQKAFPAVTQTALDMARKFSNLTGATFDVNGAAKALGDAMQDPAKGARLLKQYIGALTPAEQDAINIANKHGDTLKAQGLLLADVQKRVNGASASYKDGAAGGIMAFQTGMNNIQKTIGMGFLPILNQALQAVLPFVTQLATNLPGAIATVQAQVKPFVSKVQELIGNLAKTKPVVDGIKGAFQQLQPFIGPVLIAMAIGAALGAAPLAILVAVIALIVIGLKKLWEVTEPVRTAIGNFLGVLGNLKDLLVTGVQAAIANVIARLQAFWQATQPVRDAIAAVIATAIELRQKALEALQPAIDNVNSKLSELHSWFNDKVLPVIMAVHAFFQDKILPVLEQVGTFIKDRVVAQLQSMWTVFQTQILPILEQVGSWIKDRIIANLQSMWNTIQTRVLPILSDLASRLKTGVGAEFQLFGNIVSTVFGHIGDLLGALGNLKDKFSNLHLAFPSIKLPHFSITGNLSINPPSVPHLDVSWYAGGGIFTSPSIIGVGEAGPEAVIPLNRAGSFGNGNGGAIGPLTVVLEVDGRAFAQATTTRYVLPEMVDKIRLKAGIRAM